MGAFFIALALFWSGLNYSYSLTLDQKMEMAQSRCAEPEVDEPVIYTDFFPSNMSQRELDAVYKKTYQGEARLAHRAYFDGESFVSENKKDKDQVKLSKDYIKSVILQIEKAMKLKYVQYVFFPDMGHSHFLIPNKYYKKAIEPLSGPIYPKFEHILKAPGLKSLYHTAEKLRMIDKDKNVLPTRDLQWRFYTRNPVGDAQGNIEILTNYKDKSGHNTVRAMEGYRYYSGFNFSANHKGCFPYEDPQGKLVFFDISAWDLPYRSGADDSVEF